MAISAAGKRKLTTQCYVKGEPRNQKDFILKRVKDPNARESLIVPFEPINGSKIGETSARFDIVLGWTPQIRHFLHYWKSYTKTLSTKGRSTSCFAS